MDDETRTSILIGLTVLSTIIAFFTSSRSTRLRFGAIYEKTIQRTLRDLVLALGSIILYAAISALSHGWQNIFYSPEPAITAFLLMIMVCHSLAQGASVRSSYVIDLAKLSGVSALSLTTLCVSLLLTVTSFQSEKIAQWVAWMQVAVLIVAVFLYYAVLSCMSLLKQGYQPAR